jgi:hypothetical protein
MNYKEFNKVWLGESDIAALTLRSGNGIYDLKFGEDGSYHAYECVGDDVEIGSHYTKVFEGRRWLKVFNDYRLVYDVYFDEYSTVDIYRSGSFGCIIHWHN